MRPFPIAFGEPTVSPSAPPPSLGMTTPGQRSVRPHWGRRVRLRGRGSSRRPPMTHHPPADPGTQAGQDGVPGPAADPRRGADRAVRASGHPALLWLLARSPCSPPSAWGHPRPGLVAARQLGRAQRSRHWPPDASWPSTSPPWTTGPSTPTPPGSRPGRPGSSSRRTRPPGPALKTLVAKQDGEQGAARRGRPRLRRPRLRAGHSSASSPRRRTPRPCGREQDLPDAARLRMVGSPVEGGEP